MSKITTTLAKAQIKQNRKRTSITILGIVLSSSMLTAICGFVVSGVSALRDLVGEQNVVAHQATIISMAVVLGTIITIASIVVISGAFRISASERLRQFGILKSVGATKRQITQIVLYEAFYLSLIAIPLGIVIGLGIEWIGTSISDVLLAPMNEFLVNDLTVNVQFIFSWASIFVTIIVSSATVWISAWLPAHKAAKVPAIEAIKLTSEIKLRAKKVKTSKLIQRVFGFEGTLAAKAIKRSRGTYRPMVAALSISIILFLICTSLNTQLTMATNQVYMNIDANTISTYTGSYIKDDAYDALPLTTAEEITASLRSYPDTTIYGIGIETGYTVSIDSIALSSTMQKTLTEDQTTVPVILQTPDTAHYEALCDLAGVAVGSTILLNTAQSTINNKDTQFKPIDFSNQTITITNDSASLSLSLDAQISGADVPQELRYAGNDLGISIIVPSCHAVTYFWFGSSVDLDGYIPYAQETLLSILQSPGGLTNNSVFDVLNISSVTNMTRSITKLFTIFLYGFVGMLALIGLTSVISSISANIHLRSREFAMLQSVGMTKGGLRRMLALESIISSLKALLYGIPLGSIAMYLLFRAITIENTFEFIYPWFPLVEIAGAVFIITFIITQYSANKVRKGSIIEAIHSSDGI